MHDLHFDQEETEMADVKHVSTVATFEVDAAELFNELSLPSGEVSISQQDGKVVFTVRAA
jgi:hypothetical protein